MTIYEQKHKDSYEGNISPDSITPVDEEIEFSNYINPQDLEFAEFIVNIILNSEMFKNFVKNENTL